MLRGNRKRVGPFYSGKKKGIARFPRQENGGEGSGIVDGREKKEFLDPSGKEGKGESRGKVAEIILYRPKKEGRYRRGEVQAERGSSAACTRCEGGEKLYLCHEAKMRGKEKRTAVRKRAAFDVAVRAVGKEKRIISCRCLPVRGKGGLKKRGWKLTREVFLFEKKKKKVRSCLLTSRA